MLEACGENGNRTSDKSSIPENPGNVYRVITCDESGVPETYADVNITVKSVG